MKSLQTQLIAEGHCVSLSKLCAWLGIPRRLIYYKPKARTRRVDPNLAEHVGVTMRRFPTYGYRRLAIVLGEHKKPIQRILQIKDCQVRKRSQGFRPRAKALPSVSHRLDECWATDICEVWWDRDRRDALAAVIDCCTREILRWRLSSRGATETAEATLEEVDQPHGESLS